MRSLSSVFAFLDGELGAAVIGFLSWLLGFEEALKPSARRARYVKFHKIT